MVGKIFTISDTNANKVGGKGKDQIVRLRREIGLLEGVAITIGAIIGSGIFISPKGVVTLVGSVGLSLTLWAACGVISICGAMVFAELGTLMPGSGGEFYYLNETFGSMPAFLFIWVSNLITGPASFAILSLTFAKYVTQPFYSSECKNFENLELCEKLVAACAISLLTFINCRNFKKTIQIQNLIMFTKVTALCLIILAGAYSIIFQGKTENFEKPFADSVYDPAIMVLAFYSSVWAYAGWNALNNLTEELKDPNRNLPLAIKLSLSVVIVIYVLTNIAYFSLLSPQEMMQSEAIAVTFEEKFTGSTAIIIPICVSVSVFGSLSIAIMGSSRVLLAGARVGHFPKVFGYLSTSEMTPVPSLVFHSVFALIFLAVSSNIYTLISYTGFIGSFSNLAMSGALLYLRKKCPDQPRPIKVSLVYPIVFFIVSLLVCVLPIYKKPLAFGIGVGLASTGFPIYYFFIHKQPPKCIKKLIEIFSKVVQKVFMSVPEDGIENNKIGIVKF